MENKNKFINKQKLNHLMENDNWFYIDIDNTLLVQDDKINIPDSSRIEMELANEKFYLIPHSKNIQTLKNMWDMGFTCVAWSAAGQKWAMQAIEKLNLKQYIHIYLSKPNYYMDDKQPEEWMGMNLFQDL